MDVTEEKVPLLQKVVQDLNCRKLDEALILDTANAAAELVEGHYFAFCLFDQAQARKPVFISNNPPDFIPIYLSVLDKDFLIKALLEGGQEYVLQRSPEYYMDENAEFNEAVQTARPISDIIYEPISVAGEIRGYTALGRAGLHNAWYSDSEIELFRFISSFLDDAFKRSFIPAPEDEDLAYLDRNGNFISYGTRIGDVCSELLGWKGSGHNDEARRNRGILSKNIRNFLSGNHGLGDDRMTLESGERRVFFLLQGIEAPFSSDSLQAPRVKIRLLDKTYSQYVQPLLDLPSLSTRYGITQREFEVIQGIFRAQSNKVIASELHVDESTVKRHTHNIYEKTGLKSRVELVQRLL